MRFRTLTTGRGRSGDGAEKDLENCKGLERLTMGALYDENPREIRCRFARLLIFTVGL